MELLDVVDQLARANGEKANRNLVFAFADHDIKLDRALELARAELEFRRDIYSYDALAWALYGDPSRAAELVERNRVGTSLFMPAAIDALSPDAS